MACHVTSSLRNLLTYISGWNHRKTKRAGALFFYLCNGLRPLYLAVACCDKPHKSVLVVNRPSSMRSTFNTIQHPLRGLGTAPIFVSFPPRFSDPFIFPCCLKRLYSACALRVYCCQARLTARAPNLEPRKVWMRRRMSRLVVIPTRVPLRTTSRYLAQPTLRLSADRRIGSQSQGLHHVTVQT